MVRCEDGGAQASSPAWDRKEINRVWTTKDDKSSLNKEKNNSCSQPRWEISLDIYTTENLSCLSNFEEGKKKAYPSKLQSCHWKPFFSFTWIHHIPSWFLVYSIFPTFLESVFWSCVVFKGYVQCPRIANLSIEFNWCMFITHLFLLSERNCLAHCGVVKNYFSHGLIFYMASKPLSVN